MKMAQSTEHSQGDRVISTPPTRVRLTGAPARPKGKADTIGKIRYETQSSRGVGRRPVSSFRVSRDGEVQWYHLSSSVISMRHKS